MAKKNYLSIDLGNSYIKVVEGRNQKNEIHIDKMFSVKLPEEVYSDGTIHDENKFKLLLKAEVVSKVKATNTLLTLSPTSIIVRNMKIPSASDEEVYNMAKYELQELLPVDFEDYVFDYRKVRDLSEENSIEKLIEVQAAVMPAKLARSMFDLLKSLGLKPVSLNVNNSNAFKLFNGNYSEIDFDKSYYALDLGGDSIGFTVIDHGNQVFSRTIDIKEYNIDKILKKPYNLDEENFFYKLKNSVDLKRYTLYYDKVDADKDYDMEFEKELVTTINQINGEIQKTSKYYKTKEDFIDVDGILIYGGYSCINGLVEYIINSFNYEVLKINNFKNIYGFDDKYDYSTFINAIANLVKR